MKKMISITICVLLVCGLCLPAAYALYNENEDYLTGEWSTGDGVTLCFHEDGSYTMDWGWLLSEGGDWRAEDASGSSFVIDMEGSLILTLMSMVYGSIDGSYHFEILKCNQDNFYLVQVYGGYTAASSPCKLGFTRAGKKSDFTIAPAATPTPAPVIHTVKSDKDSDSLSFTFKANEEIEDLLGSASSMRYEPRLAHFLSVMARAAYQEETIKANYSTLGFEATEPKHYEDDEYAGYLISKKTARDGSCIVLITIRGSSTSKDWTASDFNHLLDENFMDFDKLTDERDWHAGFSRSAEQILEDLKKYLGGELCSENTTYVITGHSLGAGAGNLLAVRLGEEGVPPSAVFAYDFACPNVGVGSTDISFWNHNGIHNNIINIGNWCDQVTHAHVPTNDVLNFSDVRWKRYGQSYWFTTGYNGAILRTVDQNPIDAHDMKVYVEYMSHEYDASHFIDTEYVVGAVSARCPVDIVVYDASGRPVAGVAGNKADYYGFDIGVYALILVDGDQKCIYLFGEEPFGIRLTATAAGEMDYSVGRVDLFSGTAGTQRDYQSVKLEAGKEMAGLLGGGPERFDAGLFVLNESGEIIAEVKTDGSETAIDPDREQPAEPATSSGPETASSHGGEHREEKMVPLRLVLIAAAAVVLLAVVVAAALRLRRRR